MRTVGDAGVVVRVLRAVRVLPGSRCCVGASGAARVRCSDEGHDESRGKPSLSGFVASRAPVQDHGGFRPLNGQEVPEPGQSVVDIDESRRQRGHSQTDSVGTTKIRKTSSRVRSVAAFCALGWVTVTCEPRRSGRAGWPACCRGASQASYSATAESRERTRLRADRRRSPHPRPSARWARSRTATARSACRRARPDVA